jgi:hypothetical protein
MFSLAYSTNNVSSDRNGLNFKCNVMLIVWSSTLDQYVVAEIKEDIERIVEKDSRVEMTDIFTDVLDHTISITLHLKFKPFLSEDTLFVKYARENIEI